MTTPSDHGDDRVRIEFTRSLTLRRFSVAKGSTWDTWRSRIADDGSVDIDGSIVNSGHWVEVATWRPGVVAPPLTKSQEAAWLGLHAKEGAK
jgi:hypothetical protein